MMKQAILALALAGSAQAMCPNQCSGHGVCKANPKDSCACYSRRETYDEFGTYVWLPLWIDPRNASRVRVSWHERWALDDVASPFEEALVESSAA